MASTQSKSTRNSGTRTDGESARWIFGLLLLFIGIFLMASVVFYYFYWRADCSVLHGVGSENPNFDATIENPCGKWGAWAAEIFVGQSFGLFGIVIPFILAMMGTRILRRQPVLFHHSVLSSLLILILGSLTLGVAFDDGWKMFNSGWGGAFGLEMGRLLKTGVGTVGSAILLLGGWILTGVFINRNFINTVNRAGNALVGTSEKLVGTVAHKVPSLQSIVKGRRAAEDAPDDQPSDTDSESRVPVRDAAAEETARPERSEWSESLPSERKREEASVPAAARRPDDGSRSVSHPAASEEEDPFVVHTPDVAPVSGGVETVNDYYARNRAVAEDDPFVEHPLDDDPDVGSVEKLRSPRCVSEEGEFVEIDLGEDAVRKTDDTAQTTPPEEENPFAEGDSGDPFVVREMPGPSDASDASGASDAAGVVCSEGVVVTVEEHHDKLVDERRIATESYDPLKDLINYRRPSVTLLEDYISDSEVTDEEIYENKSRIEETLKNFGIPIQRIKATTGPTVTLYEIVQAQGVKISRIQSLQNDIAQSLKALGIRIIAPIPGKGTIGIEVPNRNKEIVSMYSAIRSLKFQESKAELPVVIGRTIQNENYVFDLAKMPHLLVAGATGQGKSVGLNAIITSLLYKKHPAQLKFVMIDPKMVEFSLYAKIERHFLAKMESEEEAIITDPRKAVYTLNSLCTEMESRLALCKDAGARNIKEYNEKFTARRLNPLKGHRFLPYIVVVVDEFADLIMTAKEVEGPVMRLAQKARAVGIHLIIATQRPDVKVITGGIKANFPARIAFRVMQMIDSRTIIDRPGAEQLIGRGDMLFSNNGELTRIQCALVDTPEVERIVDYISKQQGYTSAYSLPDYTPESGGEGGGAALGSESSAPVKYDSKFAEIARDAVTQGQISTSMIQRNYEVGFNRAGRIMMQLERAGIVGRQEGAKPRDILYHDLPSLEARLQELGLF